jgi:hypothetical protein
MFAVATSVRSIERAADARQHLDQKRRLIRPKLRHKFILRPVPGWQRLVEFALTEKREFCQPCPSVLPMNELHQTFARNRLKVSCERAALRPKHFRQMGQGNRPTLCENGQDVELSDAQAEWSEGVVIIPAHKSRCTSQLKVQAALGFFESCDQGAGVV